MIEEKFYPTNRSLYNNYDGRPQFEMTKGILSLTFDEQPQELFEDVALPYYMGYIPYKDFPSSFIPRKITGEAGDDRVSFNMLGDEQNVSWLYALADKNEASSNVNRVVYYRDNETQTWKYARRDRETDYCFPNQMYFKTLVFENQFAQCKFFWTLQDDENHTTKDGDRDSFVINLYPYQIKELFEGDGIEFNIRGHVYRVTMDDYSEEDNAFIFPHFQDTTYIHLALFEFSFISFSWCPTSSDPSTATGKQPVYETRVTPFFKWSCESDALGEQNLIFNYPFYPGYDSMYVSLPSNFQSIPSDELTFLNIVVNQNSTGAQYLGQNHIWGGRDAEFTAQELAEEFKGRIINNFASSGFIKKGYAFQYNSGPSGVPFWCIPMKDIRELYLIQSLTNKCCKQDDNNYQGNQNPNTQYINDAIYTYTPDTLTEVYTDENVPTWELISGEYDSIESMLQEWQKGELTANKYNDFDKPEVEDGDGDEEGEDPEDAPEETGKPPSWDGFSMVPDSEHFTLKLPADMLTLYCLTDTQMDGFSGNLWASIGSDEFLENMWTALFNTASLDYSEVLKYIPVCRYYPIDFRAHPMHNVLEEHTQMLYFARGFSPIDIGSSCLKFNNPITVVGQCNIVVPEASDWRDLEPYSKAFVIIPFCGQYEIPVNDVVGCTLQFETYCNVITGEMLTYVSRITDSHKTILMTASGSIGYDIPLTTDTSALKLGMMAVSAGVPAVVTGAVGAEVAGVSATVGKNPFTDEAAKTVMGDAVSGALQASGAISGAGNMLGANVTGGVSGVTVPSFGGVLSMGYPNYCYLIIKRNNIVRAGNHGSTNGYNLKHQKTLNSCRGWTVCTNPKVSGIAATVSELNEIQNLLATGIYA